MRIKVGKAHEAIVDDHRYNELSFYRWAPIKAKNGKIYAQAKIPGRTGHGSSVLMHRMVLGVENGDPNQVDHINHNTLDCRESNLRLITPAQNKANRRSLRGVSKYKGVTFDKQANKFKASIGYEFKHINLGRFATEEEAARAYDSKSIELYGEFAYLNFPKGKKNGEAVGDIGADSKKRKARKNKAS